MINLGFTTTGLFFMTGFLVSRTGSADLSAYGGLARHLPLLATFVLFLGLAYIGLPGTNGFVGEFLILLGAFRAHWALAAVGVLGVILGAAYFLWYYERAFFGPAAPGPQKPLHDLYPREWAVFFSGISFFGSFILLYAFDWQKGGYQFQQKYV